jgi:hypothetical protein
MCNGIEIDTFIDPVAVARVDRGGEGSKNCEMSFGPFLCLLNDGNRVEQFTPRYASADVVLLLTQEFEQQRAVLSPRAQQMTELVHIALTYDNKFQTVSYAGTKSIVMSGVLVRALFVNSAIDSWEGLTADVSQDQNNIDAHALARQAMLSGARLRAMFKESFRFTLAHELAHIYLGDGRSVEGDEELVDCTAIVQLSQTGFDAGAGLFELLERAYAEGVESYWGLGPEAAALTKRRSAVFRETLEGIRRSNAHELTQDYCAAALRSRRSVVTLQSEG